MASFKINPDQAVEIARRAYQEREARGIEKFGFLDIPALAGGQYVIGRYYKDRLVLTGIYVDGRTGSWEWRTQP